MADKKSSTIAAQGSGGKEIDDLLNGFVGAMVGGFEFAGRLVLGVGAVVEAAIGDVTVTCSHDRGHEAGRLGSHDPGDLPPGGQISGEALQSVAGAAGRGRGPAISAGCS